MRLGQDPDLSFAPAPLASFETDGGGPPRLQVRLFGLFGPNGPLPLHITEYARERLRLAGDPTLSRFLDVFHHRFLALFYRAWAQAQPHVNRDRPKADRFTVYVGAFIGMAPSASRDRDALPDLAKFFHVGALIRHVRNTEGLTHILQHFFRVPVQIEEFVGHWLSLGAGERTSLSSDGATLGSGAVLGGRVWDRQHKFRIRLGPLTLDQYESFLPGGKPLRKLVDWVRMYLCFELDWDVRLMLKPNEVPSLTLGSRSATGMDVLARPPANVLHPRMTCAWTRKRLSIEKERAPHERDQPFGVVRQAQQPRVQGHRGRDGVLQAARQPVCRTGALDTADSADARLRPASHRQAFRARSVAGREGRHRGARSAAARRDLDLGLFIARRECGRARLGLRDADVRGAARPHGSSRRRNAEDALAAECLDRASRASSSTSRRTR